jgi:protein disulfide-isomerase A1
MSANEFVLVEFYAPWCGHCKKLAPEYSQAAQKLEKDGSTVKLAKVDATVAKTLANKFEIKGFPTLKFFRSGTASNYEGGRTSTEIVSWVTKKSGPLAKTIITEDDLLHMKEANDVFAIGYFEDVNSDSAKLFLNAAGELDHINFAISSSDLVKNALSVEKNTIVVVKTFDDLRNEMVVQDFHTAKAVSKFIGTHASKLIQEFSDETSDSIFKSPIQKHVLFFTDVDKEHHEEVNKAFQDAALAYRGETLMINVPKSEGRVLEYFGIEKNELPKSILADMGNPGTMKKYPFDGPFTSTDIQNFLKSALAGEIKPHLKSEEPVPSDTEGDVVVVKGTTFDDIVMNNSKDVLLEFYAPWCGHCKQLAPIYDALGKAFEDEENIIIAKMDATANEIDNDSVQVRGFPTIMWFKGDDKENPKVYSKGREEKDFIDFIKQNAFNEITKVVGGTDGDEEEDDDDDDDDERDEL